MTITVPNEIRPAWKRFLPLCEKKLRKHDGDWGTEGWRGYGPEWLLLRLYHETAEFTVKLHSGASPEDLAEAAADIANQAMMLGDIFLEYRKEDGEK